jgi:hypothetical protein
VRRCIAIDSGERSFPRPDNRSGDLQAFAVLELQQSIGAEIESARRLVRAAEESASGGRTRTLLGLLESIDVALVNIGIYATDSEGLSEDIARAMRTLTLDAQITQQWHVATVRPVS